jgi:hypothetical protein
MVTFISKSREMTTKTFEFWLLNGPKEVLDRLQYFCDIINQLVSQRK